MPADRHDRLRDKDWLCREYLTLRRTRVAIAAELGVAPSAVDTALRRHGIKRSRVNADEARRLYVEEGLSLDAVAARLGVGATTVRRALDEVGVKRRPSNVAKPRPDDQQVRHLYLQGVGLDEIARQLGRNNASSVWHQLRRMGVPPKRRWRNEIDADWLRRAYVKEGRSINSLAREMGVKWETIARHLDRLRLRPR